MLALIERVESEPKMDSQRAVEHGCCEPPPPESYKPSPSSFHGLKRDQSQGVIDEVGCEIGQQHETRDKAYASNGHGAGQSTTSRRVPSTLLKSALWRARHAVPLLLLMPIASQLFFY